MPPEPIAQIMFYASLMGLFHLALIFVSLVLAVPLLFIDKTKFIIFARGFTVFNVILWFSGMAANLLWDTFVFGTIYVSMDYIFDFVPFLPITQGHINQPWGDQTGQIFHGLNIYHVQALWFLFAFFTWMTTIYIYSRVRSIWIKGKSNKQMENICA